MTDRFRPLHHDVLRLQIEVVDDVVVVRSANRSTASIAKVLGRLDHHGREHLVLDRRIHGVGQTWIDGWEVTGAVTTELIRSSEEGAAEGACRVPVTAP